MKYTRISLLKSSFDAKNYHYIKHALEQARNKVNKKVTAIDDFSIAFVPLNNKSYNDILSICVYKQQIFLGLYNSRQETIHFNDIDVLEKINIDNIGVLVLRFENFIDYRMSTINPVKDAWLKTQPLLDKVIEIKEQYKIYKENKNQYEEENIPNKGYLRNIDYAIDKYVSIYECLQELLYYYQKNNIPVHFSKIDFDKETILVNNKEIFDAENNKFLVPVNKEDISIKTIHDTISNHKNNILLEIDGKIKDLINYGHVIKKNFLKNNVVEIKIDKKEKSYYKENNIDSICEFLNKIEEMIKKEQALSIEKEEKENPMNENECDWSQTK